MAPTPKYRPSLTATDIKHILSLAKLDMSPESVSIIKTLAPFEAKIDNNAISPAFETKPKLSLEEQLGMVEGIPNTVEILNKEQFGKLAYQKYQAVPTNCSLQEIEAAREYMYVNDLMTPEEEADYERECRANEMNTNPKPNN